MLSARKAAQRLSCAPDYVSKLCREGKLDGVRDNSGWFISVSSVAAFEKAREEARVTRSNELSMLRKQENIVFKKEHISAGAPVAAAENTSPFKGLFNFPRVSVALGAVLLFAAIVSAGNTTSEGSGFFGRNQGNQTAALAQVSSPFFGNHPFSITITTGEGDGGNIFSALAALFTPNKKAATVAQNTPVQAPAAATTTANNPIASNTSPAAVPGTSTQKAGTTIQNITNPVIERTIEHTVSGVSEADLDLKLSTLENAMRTLLFTTIGGISNSLPSSGGIQNNIALSQHIDQLSGTTLTNVIVNGIAGLTDADIPDNITINTTSINVTATSSLAGIILSGVNCSAFGNSGKLTTDALGNVICGDDYGSSGAGSPGGANGTVQYNDAGGFGGSAGFAFNKASGVLTVPQLAVTSSTTLQSVTAGNATTTNLFATNAKINSIVIGSLTGPLTAVNGVVSATLSLGVTYGGTGLIAGPSYGQVLVGNNAGGYTLVSTSSLGIASTGGGTWGTITGTLSNQADLQSALDNKLSLAAWYATTTDGLTQGIVNKYYSDTLVQNYLNTLSKGYFFSTSSVAAWKNVTDLFSTTSASYFLAQNQGNTFSTTSANAFINASSSIPHIPGLAVGDLLYWTGSSWGVRATSTLGLGGSGGGSVTSVDAAGGTTGLAFTGGPITGAGVLTLSGTLNVANGGTGSTTLSGLLKGNGTGGIMSAVAGVDYVASNAGDWTGTFGGLTSAYYLANSFSTSSANYWKGVNDFFATTSAQYFLSQNQGAAFSTTSANALLATYDKGYFFSTTSALAWKSINDFFSTSSSNYWKSQNDFFSTTSASNFLSLNQGAAFSTTSANYFSNASTTIAKTYTTNAFTALQTFNAGLTANALTIAALNGPLAANNGIVSATTSIGVVYGGTGLTAAPSLGQILVGQANGTYALTSTSSLGFLSASYRDWQIVNGYLTPTSTLGVLIAASSTIGNGTATGGLTVAGDATTTGLLHVNGTGTSTFNSNLAVGGNIVPTVDNTYSLGDPSHYFKDLYLGAHSLYVNGQQVVSTNGSNDVVLSSSPNENLIVQTSGTANIEFNPIGGTINFKNTINVSAGKSITTSDLSALLIPNGVAAGNITISGHTITPNDTNGGIFLTPNGSGGTYVTAGNFGVGTTSPSQLFSVNGGGYFTGGLGVGVSNGTAGSIVATGNANFGGSLRIGALASCTGSQALQTDGSGNVSCGSIAVSGSSAAGGWATNNAGRVTLATTTDLVAVGATSTPYAKFAILSGGAGTTTLALVPANGQTANIIDIYSTSGTLSSVLTAGGQLGLGTTSPSATLAVQGNGLISGNLGAANITATGTLNVSGNTTLSNATLINGTSTTFAITGTANTLLKTLASGAVVAAVAGTDYVANTTGNWSGTFGGQSSAYYLANSFSTSSAAYFLALNQGNAFSTSSATAFLNTIDKGYFFSTTSAIAWKAANDFFSTTSATYFLSVNQGLAFSTTSSNVAVNTFIAASTTIPKTYASNTFTGSQTLNGGVTIGSLNGLLNANNGVVGTIATSALGLLSSSSLSAAAPLAYNINTGAFSITQSGTGQSGYLSAADFNTFNNKISSTSLSAGAGIGYNAATGVITNTIGYAFVGNATTTNIAFNGGLSATNANITTLTAANILATGSTTLQNFTANNGTTTNATTTTFAISGISGALLKTLSSGAVVAATAGSDYLTSAFVFAYPFIGNATSTTLTFNGGLVSVGSTTINGNANITGTATIGNLSGLLNANNGVVGTIATNTLGLLGSSSLSAVAPLAYNQATGSFSITQSGTGANGYLSSADFNTFNNKISSTSLSGGTGIGYVAATGIITNTGVTSIIAGQGIAVSGASGAVTVSNAIAYPFIGNATTTQIAFNGGLTATNASFTNSTSTNATTTNLAITGVSGALLKTLSSGAVVAAVLGTDYVTNAQLFAWPFDATVNYGVNTSATSTPIFAQAGLFASSTSHFANADFINSTSTNATSTNLFASNAIATSFSGVNAIIANATTTNIAITGLTANAGQCLSVSPAGNVVTQSCQSGSGAAAFSFLTNYGQLTAATSSALWAQNGIFASSTSHFANADFINASSTNATTTNLFASVLNVTNATLASLQLGSGSGALISSGGAVSAGVVAVGYGGTGLASAPAFGQLLVGNGVGGYNLSATSSLGINFADVRGVATDAQISDALTISGGTIDNSPVGALSPSTGIFTNSTSTNATTTNLYINGTVAGAGLTSCSTAADKLLWNSVTRQFSCGTDQSGGSGSDGNFTFFNNSGIRLATSSNQVLLGDATHTSTSTLSKLEIYGGITTDTIVATNATTTSLYASGQTVVGGRLGVGTTSPSANLSVVGGNILQVASGNPTLAASIATANHTLGSFVSGNFSYVADKEGGLKIYDVTNPKAPVLTGSYTGIISAEDVAVSGRFAYVANGTGGLSIIDVSRPNAPTLAGTYATGGSAHSLALSGKYVYITDASGFLRIVDISNPAAPVLAGSYSTGGAPRAVAVSGKYAYILDDAIALYIVDVSNPSNPTSVGSYTSVALDTPSDIYVSGRYAYVADRGTGFSIFNISNPASPVVVSTYSGAYNGVAVAGNLAYLADNNGTLTVVDISAPKNPVLVGSYSTGSTPNSVYVAGKYAYLSANANGLQIVDINGASLPSANIGSIDANVVNITDALSVGGDLYTGGGISTGFGGILSRGGLSVLGSTTLSSSLSVAGSTTLQNFTAKNAVLAQATTSAFAITGATSTLLKTNANGSVVAAIAGVDYLTGASLSAWPFTPATFGTSPSNATSTLIGFNAGLYALASSTIGNGTQGGGLTISGGATTTGNSYIAVALSIATTSQVGILNIASPGANANLINISRNDSINKWAIGNVNSDLQIESYTGNSAASSNSIFTFSKNGNIGIGTTSPATQLSVQGGALISGNAFIGGSITSTSTITGANLVSIASSTIGGAFNSVASNLLASTTLLGSTLLSNATTTTFAISNVSNALLKTLSSGAVVAATPGTDYLIASNIFAYPFLSNATSTTLTFNGGLVSVGSTTINGNANITGTATIGNLSGLLNATNGVVGTIATNTLGLLSSSSLSAVAPLAYNQATGAFSISQSGTGANGYLSSADFNTFNNKISSTSLSAGAGINYNSATGVITNTIGYDFIGNATTTQIAFNGGLTATAATITTLTATNATFTNSTTTNATTTNFAITGISGSLLKTLSSGAVVAAIAGTDYATVAQVGGAFPFTPSTFGTTAANATSTLIKFNAGIASLASSTIGNGSQNGGLTVNGGATTTGNAYFAGNVGIGANPESWASLITSGTIFSGQGFSLANNGKYAIGDSTNYFTGSDVTDYLAFFTNNQESLRITSNGNVGIGTTTPAQTLSVQGGALISGNLFGSNITATGTISGTNVVATTATTTNLAVTSITNALLKTNALGQLVAAVAGTDYLTSATAAAFPFTPSALGNSTSTLIILNNGVLATASSTIGNGSQIGGLTVSGGATTTGNAYIGGNLGIGANNSSYKLTVSGNVLVDGSLRTNYNAYLAEGLTNDTNPLATVGSGAYGFGLTTANQFTLFSAGDFLFRVNGTSNDLLSIKANGNVGIGSSTPIQRLSVQGGALISGNVFAANIQATGTATSTNIAITSVTNSLLKTNALGQLVAAVAGTDYLTTANVAAFPFTPTTNYGAVANSTSTPIWFKAGLQASSTVFATTFDVSANSGYKQNGQTVLTSSSTNQTAFGGIGSGQGLIANATSSALTSGFNSTAFGYYALNSFSNTGSSNTAFGSFTLGNNTTGTSNTAIGTASLASNTTGNLNVAVGASLFANTTGNQNLGIGSTALANNTVGNDNVGIGVNSLYSNITGNQTTAVGSQALFGNNSATNTVAIGFQAASGNYTAYHNQGGVYIGYNAGFSVQTGSDYNTAIGNVAGNNLTTGGSNTLLGSAAGFNLSSGSNNIAIGSNIDLPSNTGSQQLNIGNLIYGSGIYNGGSQSSAPAGGKLGIGTTTPSQTLSVQGGALISGNVFAGNLQATGTATSTNIAITSVTNSLLKTNALGQLVAAVAGTDYLTTANVAAFPFTPSTFGNTPSNATSTLVGFNAGFYSLASSTIGNGTQQGGLTINGGATTTGNEYVAGGLTVNGGNIFTNNAVIASGGCATFSSNQFTAGCSIGGNVLQIGAQASGASLALYANNAEQIRISGTNGNVGLGSTTPAQKLSVQGGALISGDIFGANITATGTITGTNVVATTATTTNLAVTSITNSLLKTNALGQLVAAVAGTDYAAAGSGAFPFTPSTFGLAASNATSTLIGFNAGLYSLASSTIGNGTQNGGLTINGGATTTGNAYVGGNVAIGTTSIPAAQQLYQLYAYGNGIAAIARLDSNSTDSSLQFTRSGTAQQTWSLGRRNSTSSFVFAYGANTTGGLSTGEVMVLTNTGNVGIGTTTPASTLSVQGGVLISGNVFAANIQATGTATSTNIAITSVTNSLLKTNALGQLVAAVAGVDYAAAAGTGADFTPSTFGTTPSNATSTLIGFNGGLYALASSTIGNGTQQGGLTVNGGATTTGILTGLATGQAVDLGSGASNGIATYAGFSSQRAQVGYDGSSAFLKSALTGGLKLIVNSNTVPSLQITSNGNVGLGTTTPFAKLSINNNTNDPAGQPLFAVASSTSNSTTTVFTINNAGQVIIGGAAPINSTAALTVVGNASVSSNLVINSGTALARTSNNLVLNNTTFAASSGINFNVTSGSVSTEAGRFDTTGNLGVGTTTPTQVLSVQGGVLISGNLFGSNITATGTITGTNVVATTATTTNLAVTSITNSLLKTNALGQLVAAVAGVDYATGASGAFPFTPTTNYGAVANSTSTPIWFQSGLQASSTVFATSFDVQQNSSYKQGGQTILTASSTTFTTIAGIGAGRGILANATSSSFTSGINSTAFGYQSLGSNGYNGPLGNGNTAFGVNTLFNNSTGSNNAAFGNQTLQSNTTGSNNLGVGTQALQNNQGGSDNIVVGTTGLFNNVNGNNNIGIGSNALFGVQGSSNTAIGYFAGAGNFTSYTNTGSTLIGYRTGYGLQGGSDYNTLIGYQAGQGLTTGTQNVVLGGDAGGVNVLSTGSNNILLGYGASATTSSATNSLNIGNILYGTGVTAGFTPSAGAKIGIGTTTPSQTLSVQGGALISGNLFGSNITATGTITGTNVVATTATTTNFAVSSITNSLLKTNALGQLVAAVAGTDYAAAGSGAFPFTPSTFGTSASNATSTLIGFNAGLYSLASSTIGGGTQATGFTVNGGATTTGNAYFAGNVGIGTQPSGNRLEVNGAVNVSSTVFANAFSLDALNSWNTTRFIVGGNIGTGTTTPSAQLSVQGNALISGNVFAGNITATGTLSAANSNFTVDTSGNANANSYALGGLVLYSLSGGNTILSSPSGKYLGLFSNGSESGRFDANGNFGIGSTTPSQRLSVQGGVLISGNVFAGNIQATGTATSTNIAITSVTNSLLKTNALGQLVAAVAGTDYAAAGSSAFPFTPSTFGTSASNATSTLIGFNAGFYSLASSTIGDGTATGGLTVSGNATTTGNLYVGATPSAGNANLFVYSSSAQNALYVRSNSGDSVVIDQFGTLQVDGLLLLGFDTNAANRAYSAVGDNYITSGLNSGSAYNIILKPSSTGNVGVGTTSPSQMLSVQGNGLFSGNIFAGNITSTGTASSTNLVVSSLGASAGQCLTTDATGLVISQSCAVSGAGAAYPFIPSNNFGVISQATTGIAWFQNGIQASSTSNFTNSTFFGTVGIGTTTPALAAGQPSAFAVTGYVNFNNLRLNGADAGNTINQTTGNLGITTAGGSITLGTGNGSANLFIASNGNVGLGTSSPTQILSVQGNGLFSGNISVSTIVATGTISAAIASSTNVIISSLGASAGLCLTTTATGQVISQACSAGGSGAAFPFIPSTFGTSASNATSTLIGFNAGIYALASSTIGNGNQNGGLTISGGATTTGNAYFAGKIGVGTTTPTANLAINATAGVNQFIIGSSTTQFLVDQSGNVGVGTTNPYGRLSVTSNNLQQSWVSVGGAFSLAMNTPKITALSPTRVAFTDSFNKRLYLLTYNGTTWVSGGFITFTTTPTITGLSSDRIALIDTTAAALRVYSIAGGTWVQIGSDTPITGIAAMTALSSTRIATIDTSGVIRVYDFNGNTWAQAGSDFTITSGTAPTMTTLSPNRIAEMDTTNDSLRVYDFNGTTWTQVGTGTSISGGFESIAALTPTRIAMVDDTSDSLRTYDFNGTTWSLVGSAFTQSGYSNAWIAALTPNRVVLGDSTFTSIRTYQFSSPLLYAASSLDTAYFAVSDSGYTTAESLAVRNDLRVGYGTTTSPSLIVNGTATFSTGVGIGTTSPYASLSITGSAAQTNPLLFLASSTGSALFMVDQNGNVGIGTTSPAYKIDSTGAARFNGVYINGNEVAGQLGIISTESGLGNGNNLELKASSGDLGGVVITTAGTIGIGSTTPWAKLSVDTNNLTTGVPEFAVGSSTRTDFVIAQSGYVGIGTTSPFAKFSIAMDSTNPTFIVGNQGSTTVSLFVGNTTQNGFVGIGTTTNIISTSSVLIVGNRNILAGKNIAVFSNAAGSCYISNLAVSCSSDARLKKNVSQLSPSLSDVLNLKPVLYNFNAETDDQERHSGFIAQDVQAIFPNLVHADDRGMLALDYAGFAPYLVSAIQQQETQIANIATSTAHFPQISLSDGRVVLGTGATSTIVVNAGRLDFSGISSTTILIGSSTLSFATSSNALPIISISSGTATTSGAVSVNGTLFLNGVDLSKAVASSTGTTTPEAIVSGPFASASQALKDMISGVASILVSAGQSGIRELGLAVHGGVGIFDTLISQTITANVVNADTVNTKTLCLDGLCVTRDQLQNLLNGQGSTGNAGTPPANSGSGSNEGTSTGSGEASSTPDTTAPTVSLNGNNPAQVYVGDTYTDLGATVTDDVDHNLGFTVAVNGGDDIDLSQLSLDTSTSTSYSIVFSATDQAGNTGHATRTVNVVPAQ